MPLHELFLQVLDHYPAARLEPFTNHPVGTLVRQTLKSSIMDAIGSDAYDVKGSVGMGRWAETPLVAVLDPLVTSSAQWGHYVVYLFLGDGSGVYLSLNQGTTEAYRKHRKNYLEALKLQAAAIARELHIVDLITGPITLPGIGLLSKGYSAGNVGALFYAKDKLPDDALLIEDLRNLLRVYGQTTELKDRWRAEDASMESENSTGPATETGREQWHRRIERNSRLSKRAKEIHGYTCTVCAFNFQNRYGDIGKSFIEAHHLTPLSELRGRPTTLNPRQDFTVVCPNCHRMLHSTRPPLTPRELGERLR